MKELIKLINKNPDLEVVPLVYTEIADYEFSFVMGKILKCEIDYMCEYDERLFVWSDENGLDLLGYLWDEEERKSFLSDKEEIKGQIEIRARIRYEAIEWKKVIVVWIGAE
ncbi:hypothetical protein MFLO_15718 [Listeria floridensis FSL S10-1187]|uniref:Uncharacterized protein n=1 Tax=Listeria floridensis FSL S10-1187 TaxID=1265817 RepID=A0ABN0RBB8_9LIST|nr:hypothetical protein [Listeria floridensis]EUJ24249.1 hypothetical protein MFLO_15718 [Listeria floridensis FSL S10-1187]